MQHEQVELYINTGDAQQNAEVEQMLTPDIVNGIVSHTLQEAGITQQIMLTLLVTDEAGIRDMNAQYRQQDKATDVLSFPLLERPLADAPADQLWSPTEEATEAGTFVNPPSAILNLGDIVMSWPTIVRQAAEAGHSPLYELLYLLSHGVLHLVGYDDHTEAGYQAMVGIQQKVLQALSKQKV